MGDYPTLPRLAAALLERALTTSPVARTTTSPGHRDTRGLRLFRDEYPERCVGGILLHAGAETQWMADGVLVAPWWRVM